MKLPQVERCCCFGLETGGYIIAVLNLIGSLLIFIGGFMLIVGSEALLRKLEQEGMDVSQIDVKILKIVGVFVVIMAFISLLPPVVLILGISKKKSGYVKFFEILMAISLVMTLISILTGKFGLILNLLLGVYYFICIDSLRMKIKNQNQHVDHSKS